MSDNTNQNQNQNPQVSDDQELAKVLQGMQQQTRTMATSDPTEKNKGQQPAAQSTNPPMQYEETAKPSASKDNSSQAEAKTEAKQESQAQQSAPAPQSAPAQEPAVAAPAAPAVDTSAEADHSAAKPSSPGLESLKKEALEELRPLVDKLDLPPKEKFDTLLLIIRSTDDQELLEPAHEAAKSIEDDSVRAEALLDIVKEVDYFAGQK